MYKRKSSLAAAAFRAYDRSFADKRLEIRRIRNVRPGGST
jgi:hypothetical protein